jgi:hypothetical protein
MAPGVGIFAGTRIEVSVQKEPPAEPGAMEKDRTGPLPVVRASALEVPARCETWLIEHLWTDQAVSVISGGPKIGKTWLALEMAGSVAAGSVCLGMPSRRRPT